MKEIIDQAVKKYQALLGKTTIISWYEKQINSIYDAIYLNEFITIQNAQGKNIMLLETESHLLWEYITKDKFINRREYVNSLEENIKSYQSVYLSNWQLPNAAELFNFAKKNSNPYRKGSNFRLFENNSCLFRNGSLNLDSTNSPVKAGDKNSTAYFLLLNRVFLNKQIDFLTYCYKEGFSLLTAKSDGVIQKLAIYDLLNFEEFGLFEVIKKIDYTPVRLPELNNAQLFENSKGLWEFYGLKDQETSDLGIKDRNPEDDIREGSVAIDFGTSSTVVAIEENGRAELLRIGLKDFNSDPEPEHFENPTVLEFVNLPNILESWKEKVYRPFMNWNDLKGSHEAKYNLHYNSTDIKVVSSILAKLKQWALREDSEKPVILTDQTSEIEHQLAGLIDNSPTKGVPLQINENYLFDPIELYAWMLGMMINTRKRGIFLNYYMTFPVDYPRATKDKILSSFRRGIQRSFPQTLTVLPPFAEFHVSESGTEPAAYAAVALKELSIPCTESGSAYGIFDFGGGTTDFDFGVYREPTESESDLDYEEVIEHLYASGDKFLGGENILENLAFIVFKENLSICRENNLIFTKPINAQRFAGDELLIDHGSIARTNTTMMIGVLRHFWETGNLQDNIANSGILKIILINAHGKKVDCEFEINAAPLENYIKSVIEQGVLNFFMSLKTAFKENDFKTINILMAGNSCKSPWVKQIFGLSNLEAEEELHISTTIDQNSNSNEPIDLNVFLNTSKSSIAKKIVTIFGEKLPIFKLHLPLSGDSSDIYAPTGKTGVALGLLKICPGGEPILVINKSINEANGEAPFLYFVGRIKNNKFNPALKQGEPYEKWVETGVVRDGYFNLVYTQSPNALSGEIVRGDTVLKEKKVKMANESDGHRVYIRALKPNVVELCTCNKGGDSELSNVQVFELD